MDIRLFFGGQASKSVTAGTSKKTAEGGAKSKTVSEKSGKAKSRGKGNDVKRRKSSKTSESDDERPTKKSKSRKKSRNVFDSDSSGEEPLPSKLRKTSGGSATKPKDCDVAIISSDEEEALPAKLKKVSKNEAVSKISGKETSAVVKSPVKVITNVSEYFGSKPVERTYKVLASKRKERSEDNNNAVNRDNHLDNTNKKHGKETAVDLDSPQKDIFQEQPSKKARTSFSDTERTNLPFKGGEKNRGQEGKKGETAAETEKPTTISKSASPTKSTAKKPKVDEKHEHWEAKPDMTSGKPERSETTSESTTPKKPTPKKSGEKVKQDERSVPTKKSEKSATMSKSTTPSKSTPHKPGEKTDTPDGVPSSLERKASGYRSFMTREGPQALGSKEIPKGSEDCLTGLVFVITGVLESIEREDAQDLIKRHGGKVTQAVSKKTSYIVVGRDPGNSKVEKAKQLGTKQLDEDGLFDMIRSSSKKSTETAGLPKNNEDDKGSEDCLTGLVFVITGVLESIERDDAQDLIKRHGGKVTQAVSKKTSYIVVGRDPGNSKVEKAKQLGTKQLDEDGLFDMIRSSSKKSTETAGLPKNNEDDKKSSNSPKNASQTYASISPSQRQSQSSALSSACSTPATQTPSASPLRKAVDSDSLLWVDKYSPKSIKQIIGQQGDKSNVKKLLRWLQNWHTNQKAGKSKAGYFAGKEDGSIFKAALLSGPPGVGKTTTANLVCKESGFSFVEFNASDSRSKKTLEQYVSEVLDNKTIDGYLTTGPKTSSEKHVLIMDEVDGMAGNEDRGGMQELINLIKSTKIPIICMCNDRNSQKVRSLANYCFDLRFHRPRVEQIKGSMMSIAFKENLKISPQAMEKVIIGANQDIRQVLHNLSMWTSKQKSLNYDEAKADADRAHKDIKLGPFDVTRKIFSAEESSKMNLQEYFSLFFNDYSLIPLFSQENYIQVVPYNAGGDPKKILKCLSDAAESFCDADLVENCIRSKGSWNLLPLQSFFSCVLPGKIMKGRMSQKIDFPSWLGKNSTTGKNSRILQDLLSHTQLSTSGSKLELNMDYVPHLRNAVSLPLIKANSENCSSKVSEVIKIMDSYNMMKEDWESILEIGHFEGRPKLQTGIESKIKSAFTRTYNKGSHLTPYSSQATTKKKRGMSTADDLGEMDNELDEEVDSEDDDIEHNPMIKVKKPTKAGDGGRGKKGGASQTNSGPKSSRGKGVSKGKAKNK